MREIVWLVVKLSKGESQSRGDQNHSLIATVASYGSRSSQNCRGIEGKGEGQRWQADVEANVRGNSRMDKSKVSESAKVMVKKY